MSRLDYFGRHKVMTGLLLIVLIAGFVIGIVLATGSGSPGYAVAPAQKGTVQESVSTPSTIQPANQADENFDASGTVESVDAYVGEYVSAGETLGTLDTSSLDATLYEDASTLAGDEAQLNTDITNQSLQSAEQQLAGDEEQVQLDSTELQSASSDFKNVQNQDQSSIAQIGESVSGDETKLSQDAKTLTSDLQTLTKDQATLGSAESSYEMAGCSGSSSNSNCGTLFNALNSSQMRVTQDQIVVSADQMAMSTDQQKLQSNQITLENQALKYQDDMDQALVNIVTAQQSLSGAEQAVANDHATIINFNANHRSQIEADTAMVDAERSQLQIQEEELKNPNVTAPISGMVVAVDVSPGNMTNGGTSTIGLASNMSSNTTSSAFTILGSSAFVAESVMNAADQGRVAVGDHVQLDSPASGKTLSGKISSIGIVSTDSSGVATFPVTIELAGHPSGLYAGLTEQSNITVLRRSGVVEVPTLAVHAQGTKDFVYEVVNNKKIERPVVVGATNPSNTQIKQGVSVGTDVVLAGHP